MVTNLEILRISYRYYLYYTVISRRDLQELPAYAGCRVCGFAVAAPCRLNGKIWLSRQWNKHYSSRPEVWCFGFKMDERISGKILATGLPFLSFSRHRDKLLSRQLVEIREESPNSFPDFRAAKEGRGSADKFRWKYVIFFLLTHTAVPRASVPWKELR